MKSFKNIFESLKITTFLFSALLCMLLVYGCSKENNPVKPDEDLDNSPVSEITIDTINVSVSLSDFGNIPLTIISAYDSIVFETSGTSQQMSVSDSSVELLVALDSIGNLKGFGFSKTSNTDTTGPVIDAESTVLGLLALSPEIYTSDNTILAQRMEILKTLPSYNDFSTLVINSLANTLLLDALSQTEFFNAYHALLSEWTDYNNNQRASARSSSKLNCGFGLCVDVDNYLSLNSFGGVEVEALMKYSKFRCVNIYRRNMNSKDEQIGDVVQLGGDSFGSYIYGADPFAVSVPLIIDAPPHEFRDKLVLFGRENGDSCELLRDNNQELISYVEYWIAGAGVSDNNVQLPEGVISNKKMCWLFGSLYYIGYPLLSATGAPIANSFKKLLADQVVLNQILNSFKDNVPDNIEEATLNYTLEVSTNLLKAIVSQLFKDIELKYNGKLLLKMNIFFKAYEALKISLSASSFITTNIASPEFSYVQVAPTYLVDSVAIIGNGKLISKEDELLNWLVLRGSSSWFSSHSIEFTVDAFNFNRENINSSLTDISWKFINPFSEGLNNYKIVHPEDAGADIETNQVAIDVISERTDGLDDVITVFVEDNTTCSNTHSILSRFTIPQIDEIILQSKIQDEFIHLSTDPILIEVGNEQLILMNARCFNTNEPIYDEITGLKPGDWKIEIGDETILEPVFYPSTQSYLFPNLLGKGFFSGYKGLSEGETNVTFTDIVSGKSAQAIVKVGPIPRQYPFDGDWERSDGGVSGHITQNENGITIPQNIWLVGSYVGPETGNSAYELYIEVCANGWGFKRYQTIDATVDGDVMIVTLDTWEWSSDCINFSVGIKFSHTFLRVTP